MSCRVSFVGFVFLSFCFLSFTMAAPKPTFTAAYAHKRAARNAFRLAAGKGLEKECGACKGTTKMQLRVSVLGGPDDAKETVTEITCGACAGSGKVKPIQEYYSQLIHCNCRNKSDITGFLYAADGRRVFGNDTYLCRHCGFVKQFG